MLDTFAQQDCPPNLATMQNTAVYEGTKTSFPRVANGDPGEWQVASSSSVNPPVAINPGGGPVDPQYSTAYAVNSSQLTILTATTAPQGAMTEATAGIYLLNYQNAACTTGAGLVVISEFSLFVILFFNF